MGYTIPTMKTERHCLSEVSNAEPAPPPFELIRTEGTGGAGSVHSEKRHL
jgi:hypothetical protein